MRKIYNILFPILFVIASPYYFYRMWRRPGWQKGFMQRFGRYDTKIKQSVTNRHVLWIHAVSVGEMNACVQLIRALEPRMPNLKIMVSTTTSTGMERLQKMLPTNVGKIYYPIDRKKYVHRALVSIHPDAIVLMESEIWPNFIWRANAMNLPLFLVNARLSDRSFPRYKRFGFIFRKLFASFAAVSAQNEHDAARLRELGCHPEAVHVVGNLKFDTAVKQGSLDVPALLKQLGIVPGAPLLVAGSTHAGEEKILAGIFLRLRKQFPKLVLILVPRHFERASEVGKELTALGIKFVFRGDISPEMRRPESSVECLLVNTTGELMSFYEHATVVFVGKSITAEGGQNPIEPAAVGKAVVFGPNMQNFPDVVRIFLEEKSVVQVKDSAELEKALSELLADPQRRETLGREAARVVAENQGSLGRTVELIVEHLRQLDVYIAPDKKSAPPQTV